MFELLSSIADAPPAVAADRSTALVAVVVTVAAVVAADAERQSADRSDHLSLADAADLVVAIRGIGHSQLVGSINLVSLCGLAKVHRRCCGLPRSIDLQ